MEGLEGRTNVLKNLAGAMTSHPEHFGKEGGGRPGGIVGTLYLFFMIRFIIILTLNELMN